MLHRALPTPGQGEILSGDQELEFLRKENQRLKSLVELREDNKEFEAYQVQSRNKLLLLLAFTIVLVGSSTIYYVDLRHQLDQANKMNQAMAKQIKSISGADTP